MNWNNITLAKFRQLDEINSQDLPEIDKALFSTCIIFNKTEYELDNSNPTDVLKLTTKTGCLFETPFNPKAFARMGKYFIQYDISKITFGQYVELNFFLSHNQVQNAHYILATCSKAFFKKPKDHRKRADYFLTRCVPEVMGSLKRIVENFSAFNKEYSGLFGLDKEVTGDVQEDKFNKRYGWIYSASQVAEYERITLEQAFALPVRQALNDLMYLKEKVKYEVDQIKKSNNARQ